MARISGIDLPNNKKIEFALTSIYGVGHKLAEKICEELSIDRSIKAKDLPDGDVGRIRDFIEKNLP